jgi:type I restriction enzyme S subunit
MNAERLLALYERVAEAPDAIARLRRFILDLAVRGKLVPQDPQDEPASELLTRIAKEKARLGIKSQLIAFKQDDAAFDLPLGWAWTLIGEICSKTGSGSTPRGGKEVYRPSGIPFLRSQNVHDDGLRLDDVAYIDSDTHNRMSGTRVIANDLLLNITGGSIGRCCLVSENFGEANVSQHVAIVRPTFTDMGRFLHRLILSPFFQGFVFNEQTGAGRGGLPKNRMDSIPVPLPPLAEQHRIVAKVDELMALCDRLEAARKDREAKRDRLSAASLARLNTPDPETFTADARFTLEALPALTTRPNQIKQLRQTILNLAVRGRLVPQDPNDESVHLDAPSETEAKAALPASWRYIRLAELLREDTRNGYSRRPDDAPEGAPILRISAGTVRRDGVVAEEEHKLISGIDAKTRKEYGLRAGDLLACRFNGNKAFVGRLTIFNDYLGLEPIYPDKLIRVRPEPRRAVSAFLRLASETDLVRDDVELFCATTVGNWGISASNLKEVRFPVPPLAEQHRIVAKVDELMALCDRLEASLATSDQTRTRLLEATLIEALSPASISEMEAAE